MAHKMSLEAIRGNLSSHLGERIKIRANEGRKRVLEKEGVLEKTYPSIFTIRVEDEDGRLMSWSYIDVLTDAIEIQFESVRGIPADN